MEKNAIIAILTIIVLSLILTGCKDRSIYVDPAGNTMIAVTDENKNTILNSDGNIVVYQTDKDGNIETDESGVPYTLATIFPERIINGKYVQTPTYTLTLPIGWTASDYSLNEYLNKSAEAKLTIDIIEESSVLEYKERYLELFETIEKSFEDEETDAKLIVNEDSFDYLAANTKVTRLSYEIIKENVELNKTTVLLFENNGNLYKITLTASGDNFEKAKFSEFYNAINYKPYKYY